MRVKSTNIEQGWIDAGLAAMVGRFRMADVRSAMYRAGCVDGSADRAADRLLQKERKAGRIRAINNKVWEANNG